MGSSCLFLVDITWRLFCICWGNLVRVGHWVYYRGYNINNMIKKSFMTMLGLAIHAGCDKQRGMRKR